MTDYSQRFWSKVDKSDDCWLWTGACRSDGYGKFWLHGRGDHRAHRIAYGLTHGHVPVELDHRPTCPKRCVRPDHLRPVTRKQNQENRAGAQANNIVGVRGVSWHRRDSLWFVRVWHHGRVHHGGYFKKLADAEAAAIDLRNRLFTHNDLDRMN